MTNTTHYANDATLAELTRLQAELIATQNVVAQFSEGEQKLRSEVEALRKAMDDSHMDYDQEDADGNSPTATLIESLRQQLELAHKETDSVVYARDEAYRMLADMQEKCNVFQEKVNHEPHEPQPDCDCHACAIWERDKLREIVGALRWPIHTDDRRSEQATGKHPAPCARFCEANAFEIGERMLRAQIREERRLRTEFAATVERCYRMLLSEPDTKGALFKAENILREALAEQKVGADKTAMPANARHEGLDAAGGQSR